MTALRHIECCSTRASGAHPGASLRPARAGLRAVRLPAGIPAAGARAIVVAVLVCLWPALASCTALSMLGRDEDIVGGAAGGAVRVTQGGERYESTEMRGGEGPLMRVGLAEDRDGVRISCPGPCTVSVYGETTIRETAENAEWIFERDGSGFHVVGPGVNAVIGGTVRIAPLGDDPVALDGIAYRGELEVFLSRERRLSVVNIVGLESYLRGVVPREIGPRQLTDLEAVKAQAVAARTYALARGGGRSAGDYDLYATVDDQAYGGVAVEDPTSNRAIAETAGMVLYHDDAPVNAYFSSCCGGWTAAREDVWELPAEPHLIAQSDVPGGGRDLDNAYCSGSPNFTWEVEWSGDEVLQLVRTRLRETASTPVLETPSAVRDVRIVETSGEGRVKWLEVETPEGTWSVFADRVRWLLRRPGSESILRSAWFTLDVEKQGGRVVRVRAIGRGYGHGVGMCQNGALGMARRGFSYRQILEHYYPGTRLDSPAGY